MRWRRIRRRNTALLVILAVLAVVLVAARLFRPLLWRPRVGLETAHARVVQSSEFTHEFDLIPDLNYLDEPGDHGKEHLLDLFIPKGENEFPVVIFVHGGGWRWGDKYRGRRVYHNVGEAFAKAGIGCAVINYRLAPTHKHPAQIQDVAAAFNWLHRNVSKYAGDPKNLFISGHSAGAHLVALLATDKKYLARYSLDSSSIRGVMALSGPYDLTKPMGGWGRYSRVVFVRPTFGDDEKVLLDASPIIHVGPGRPPFLIISATLDARGIQLQAEELKQALIAAKVPVEGVYKINARHSQEIIEVGKEDDRTTELMVDFVRKWSEKRE